MKEICPCCGKEITNVAPHETHLQVTMYINYPTEKGWRSTPVTPLVCLECGCIAIPKSVREDIKKEKCR